MQTPFTPVSTDKASPSLRNTGVACFTTGTQIATAKGAFAVEDLNVGDLVQTMDRGLQPIRWIGVRHVSAQELVAHPNLRPIRVSPAPLGLNQLTDDLVVSPQHRILLGTKLSNRLLGENEVLVAAKQLLGLKGIEIAFDVTEVGYVHLLFDSHEIVFANGIPAESLYLGAQAQKSLTPEGRAEIYKLFPEVQQAAFTPQACRLILVGKKARTLCHQFAKRQSVQQAA